MSDTWRLRPGKLEVLEITDETTPEEIAAFCYVPQERIEAPRQRHAGGAWRRVFWVPDRYRRYIKLHEGHFLIRVGDCFPIRLSYWEAYKLIEKI